MIKHTPEPWLLDAEKADVYTLDPKLANTSYRFVADFSRGSSDTPQAEVDANARRSIACVNACAGINPEAVPDLLKALEDVVKQCTITLGGRKLEHTPRILRMSKVRAAIAKAEAESA